MGALSQAELEYRLSSFADGLAPFPTDAPCPAALIEVFNLLLRQTKRELRYDPLVKGIGFIEATEDAAVAGTVRVLSTQLVAALTGDGSGAEPGLARASAVAPSAVTPKPASKRSSR